MGSVDDCVKPGKLYVVVSKLLDSDPLEQPMIGEVIFILNVKRSAVFKRWRTIHFLFGETICDFVMSDEDSQCIKEWTDDHA